VSTSWARSGEDEDDDLRLVFIHSETVRGPDSDDGLGRANGLVLGCCVASWPGKPLLLSFSFICFLFLFYNSVLNSNLISFLFCRSCLFEPYKY
jgi:hypothetical protein